jgi:hypothetical protein
MTMRRMQQSCDSHQWTASSAAPHLHTLALSSHSTDPLLLPLRRSSLLDLHPPCSPPFCPRGRRRPFAGGRADERRATMRSTGRQKLAGPDRSAQAVGGRRADQFDRLVDAQPLTRELQPLAQIRSAAAAALTQHHSSIGSVSTHAQPPVAMISPALSPPRPPAPAGVDAAAGGFHAGSQAHAAATPDLIAHSAYLPSSALRCAHHTPTASAAPLPTSSSVRTSTSHAASAASPAAEAWTSGGAAPLPPSHTASQTTQTAVPPPPSASSSPPRSRSRPAASALDLDCGCGCGRLMMECIGALEAEKRITDRLIAVLRHITNY